MRRSSAFLLLLALLGAAGAGAWAHGARRAAALAGPRAEAARLVGSLGLTDLALFTEARYTRHLSQADRHSAFQDHPLALEHFPSGALVAPPRR